MNQRPNGVPHLQSNPIQSDMNSRSLCDVMSCCPTFQMAFFSEIGLPDSHVVCKWENMQMRCCEKRDRVPAILSLLIELVAHWISITFYHLSLKIEKSFQARRELSAASSKLASFLFSPSWIVKDHEKSQIIAENWKSSTNNS